MNVTYIIGNGFDLNLGLQTSYKDFYNYYTKRSSSTPEIEALKDSIMNDQTLENWADLEMSLGEYTEKVSTKGEMRCIIVDIVNELAAYLKREEKRILVSEEKDAEIAKEFGDIENSLKKRTKRELLCHYRDYNSPHLIDIITLNYTSTIEQLLSIGDNDTFKEIHVGTLFDKSAFLRSIHHLHHTLKDGDRPLVGVNDKSQIKNEEFRDDQMMMDLLIKPIMNKTNGTDVDEDCKQIIGSSYLFIFFGVSIGATDKDWWRLIASRLQNERNSRLVIFAYDPSLNIIDLGEKKREVISDFLSHSDLPKEAKDRITGQIYVECNSPLFNGLKNYLKKIDPAETIHAQAAQVPRHLPRRLRKSRKYRGIY